MSWDGSSPPPRLSIPPFRGVLPVVEQDVGGPDLLRGEAEVLHARVLALVPLEVVVEPTLQAKRGSVTVETPGQASRFGVRLLFGAREAAPRRRERHRFFSSSFAHR